MLEGVFFVVVVLLVSLIVFWLFILKAEQTKHFLLALTRPSNLPNGGELGMEATNMDTVHKAENENQRLEHRNAVSRRRYR